jgi:hypothetical protein
MKLKEVKMFEGVDWMNRLMIGAVAASCECGNDP